VSSEASPKKLGVIAGGGALPRRVCEACVKSGRPVFLLAIEGEADDETVQAADARTGLGAIGRTISLLKEARCGDVVLVGRVRRPDFRNLKLDLRGALLLPKVVVAARQGDDALLRVLGKVLEEEGFRLVGVNDIAEGFLAPRGQLGAIAPASEHRDDIKRGARILDALGPFDIGQAVVVCEGHVLAIEAAEGTDLMLKRCAELPEAWRGTEGVRRGVLVKLPKPGQEMRLDLPVIGIETLENAARAGLAGIAVAAGGALLIEFTEIVRRADSRGLFIVGLTEDERRLGATP
jgi:DUF1009 family protein